jgi:hypothetical protein
LTVALLAAVVLVLAIPGAYRSAKSGLRLVAHSHVTPQSDPFYEGLWAQFVAQIPVGSKIFNAQPEDSPLLRQRLFEVAILDRAQVVGAQDEADFVITAALDSAAPGGVRLTVRRP